MKRLAAWRLAQDQRVIRRRITIIRRVWAGASYHRGLPELFYTGREHRLAKWNLTCACEMCRLQHADHSYRRVEEKRREFALSKG